MFLHKGQGRLAKTKTPERRETLHPGAPALCSEEVILRALDFPEGAGILPEQSELAEHCPLTGSKFPGLRTE